jgi:organic hydroperoxide reductase OsmC/OhrA
MKSTSAPREHRYAVAVDWTGAVAGPTKTYAAYSRDHEMTIEGKPVLAASADPLFRGTASAHNPEELLVAALASCHLLAYLALCAREGIAVVAYRDVARGTMSERAGAGHFTSVTLYPHVTIDDDRLERARELHEVAHAECFIANSVNFPVLCQPTIARAK